MWFSKRYQYAIYADEHFRSFMDFSKLEEANNRAKVSQGVFNGTCQFVVVNFNSREGIPDFYVGAYFYDLVHSKSMLELEISYSDPSAIDESAVDVGLLDRMKDYVENGMELIIEHGN